MASSAATSWIRDSESTYGHGKYPFGPCEEGDCEGAACFQLPEKRVCLDHKPPQYLFIPFMGQQTKMFTASERWVLAGGGAGGSKTYGGSRLWLKQHPEEHARWKRGEIEKSKGAFLFARRTMPELTDVIEDFRNYKDVVCPVHRWNEQRSLFLCECGYKVQFGGMEEDDSWRKYYGSEWSLVALDEAWQNTVTQIEQLDSRIRCSDPVLGRKVQMYLLTNPVGSEAKQWMKRKFKVAQYPQGEVRIPVQTKLDDGRKITQHRIYIPSNLYDNPALMRDGQYEANLKRKSKVMQETLLRNNWASDEGTWVGDDWDNRRHVIDPHPIPASWPKFKCADYGYSSKGAVHWCAVDPNGGIVVYRAWSFRRLTAREMGIRVKEIESRPLKWRATNGKVITVVEPEWDFGADCSDVRGAMDKALWARNGEDGESRGEILETMGVGFYQSDKGTVIRHNAAERIRWRLRNEVADPFTDGKFVPALRFFRGTTENTVQLDDGEEVLTGPIHTLPALPYDPNDPDVPDTKADDHDWDTQAYGTGSRPVPGEQPEAEVYDFVSYKKAVHSGGLGDW